jgi:hypothetical protein
MNAKRKDKSMAVSLLGSWQAAPALLSRTLGKSAEPDAQPHAIARLLREWVPGAQAVVCRLRIGESSIQAIEGSAGGEAHRLAVTSLNSLPQGVNQPCVSVEKGLRAVSVALQYAEHGRGAFSVVISAGTFEEAGAAILGLVSFTAALVTLHLELGQMNSDLAAAQQMTREFVHEMSNSLNTMVLQAALLQAKVEEPLRHEMTVIREVGAQAAGRLRALEQACQERGHKT